MKRRNKLVSLLFGIGCTGVFLSAIGMFLPKLNTRQVQILLASMREESPNHVIIALNAVSVFLIDNANLIFLISFFAALICGMCIAIGSPNRESPKAEEQEKQKSAPETQKTQSVEGASFVPEDSYEGNSEWTQLFRDNPDLSGTVHTAPVYLPPVHSDEIPHGPLISEEPVLPSSAPRSQSGSRIVYRNVSIPQPADDNETIQPAYIPQTAILETQLLQQDTPQTVQHTEPVFMPETVRPVVRMNLRIHQSEKKRETVDEYEGYTPNDEVPSAVIRSTMGKHTVS